MNQKQTLDRARIRELLTELGRVLAEEGASGQLYLVGGGAMALAYSTDRVTSDLDAVFEPKMKIYDAARAIAQRHNLESDWLNDAVKGLLPVHPGVPVEVLTVPGITVLVPDPKTLFAMKVRASRADRDIKDIRLLYELSGFTSAQEALDFVSSVFHENQLDARSKSALLEMLES
ncbi:MAG: DUF6036 family nucleotidyltransferase [Actinomycetota bacterium]|nr:DUF6036 family nucleotidyltransferase [Actinomycetota bacterium]